jgi:hypothetical protein
MSGIIFVQVHGRAGIIEAELSLTPTIGELHDVLAATGIAIVEETFIFIDEAHEHLQGERHHSIPGFKHGCRMHVSHCKRIQTTVHYLEKDVVHEFAPGTRVRAVKAHAVDILEMPAKDAAEHVLQLCDSTVRPASDTPLHELTVDGHCAVCFDLVPEKRVEG